MSKERYTVTTKGSRTVVHWETKVDKVAARASTTGRFVEPARKSAPAKATKGPKRKK